MELRQLQYFRSVTELKSFSRAAVRVRIAQPAINRQVRKLEDEVGVALFYRDGRGAHLTEAGAEFYEPVCRALSLLETAPKGSGRKDHRLSLMRTNALSTTGRLSATGTECASGAV